MPIRPENRQRYPKDWAAISLECRERAKWRCQHPGCTALQYAVGHWRQRDGSWHWVPVHGNAEHDLAGQGLRWPSVDRWTWAEARQFAAETFDANPDEGKPTVIVLTVAHLDHQPENCAADNLRAMCQRHHLAYDAKLHRETAYTTRKAQANTPDLFAG